MAWKPPGRPAVRKQRDKWVARVDGIDTDMARHRPRRLGTFTCSSGTPVVETELEPSRSPPLPEFTIAHSLGSRGSGRDQQFGAVDSPTLSEVRTFESRRQLFGNAVRVHGHSVDCVMMLATRPDSTAPVPELDEHAGFDHFATAWRVHRKYALQMDARTHRAFDVQPLSS